MIESPAQPGLLAQGLLVPAVTAASARNRAGAAQIAGRSRSCAPIAPDRCETRCCARPVPASSVRVATSKPGAYSGGEPCPPPFGPCWSASPVQSVAAAAALAHECRRSLPKSTAGRLREMATNLAGLRSLRPACSFASSPDPAKVGRLLPG